MSSLIRAPKVNGQPRVLTVEKVPPVFNSLDNDRKSKPVNGGSKNTTVEKVEADEMTFSATGSEGSFEQNATESTDEIGGSTKYEDIPQNYYSQEVATQVSEMNARLAAVNEELENLKATIEEQRESAKNQGYDEGYKKGIEDADTVVLERLEQLDNLAHSFSEKIDSSVNENEDMLVEIAFAAVSKMLGDVMPTKEGAIAAVRQATQYVTKRDKLIFRVSEKDYQLLKDSPSQLVQNGDSSEIHIVPDQHVQLGGCILETSSGGLDSRLEIQLSNLMDTLKSVNAKRNAE